jgi:hypothetical protein
LFSLHLKYSINSYIWQGRKCFFRFFNVLRIADKGELTPLVPVLTETGSLIADQPQLCGKPWCPQRAPELPLFHVVVIMMMTSIITRSRPSTITISTSHPPETWLSYLSVLLPSSRLVVKKTPRVFCPSVQSRAIVYGTNGNNGR